MPFGFFIGNDFHQPEPIIYSSTSVQHPDTLLAKVFIILDLFIELAYKVGFKTDFIKYFIVFLLTNSFNSILSVEFMFRELINSLNSKTSS